MSAPRHATSLGDELSNIGIGILIGAATTHLAQWWAQRKDREALRRAGR